MNTFELDDLQSLLDKFIDEYGKDFGKNTEVKLNDISSLVFAKRMTESPL